MYEEYERSQIVVIEDRRPRKYLPYFKVIVVVLTVPDPETRLDDPITGDGWGPGISVLIDCIY